MPHETQDALADAELLLVNVYDAPMFFAGLCPLIGTPQEICIVGENKVKRSKPDTHRSRSDWRTL